jgi:hypothetical protein
MLPLRTQRSFEPSQHRVTEVSKFMSSIFADVYKSGAWGLTESRSGFGSNLIQTAIIRNELPAVIRALGANSILDIPCGDWYWMRHVELGVKSYIGADVLPSLIEKHRREFSAPGREFRTLDISSDLLPPVDVVFCRDCLVHFSFEDVHRALENLRRSRARYLITTTFPTRTGNSDIETGQWRPLNLCIAPFNLPPPLRLINEGCTEAANSFADKSLGVWKIADI